MNLQETREQIGKLAADANAILTAASEAGRDMTPDEERRFEAMHVDIEKLSKRRDQMARQEAVEQQLSTSTGRRTEPTQPATSTTQIPAPASRGVLSIGRADSLRALQGWFLAGKNRETDEHRTIAQRMGVDLRSRMIALRLPETPLRSLERDSLQAFEQRFQAVNQGGSPLGDGSAGGFTVQNELMRALEIAQLSFGGMRQVAQVVRTNTGAALPWPTTNDTMNEGVIVDEGGAVNEQDAVFGQLVLHAYKYSSKKVGISLELLQDSTVNMAATIGRLLGERIGRITNRHFTTGSGTGEPNGITVAATDSGVSLGGSITFNNLVDIEHSVDPAYRTPDGRWMFNDATLKAIKKLVDGQQRPLWLSGIATSEPNTILGYPYTINQHMPDLASTGDPSIVFGALNKYIIRDVMDITLMRLDEVAAESGLVVFLAFSRHDGDLLDAGTHPVKFAG